MGETKQTQYTLLCSWLIADMFSPTQIHSFKIELKKTYEIRSLSNLASLKVTDTHSIIFCLTKQYVFVKIHFIIVLRSQTVQNNFRIQSLTHQFQINYDNKMQLWVGDVRRMDAVTFSRKYFQKKPLRQNFWLKSKNDLVSKIFQLMSIMNYCAF